jgi:CheY-like chemotaxis protein
VHADPAHLEQVIMNLAINARDAMPAGGLLSIEVERCEFRANFFDQNASPPEHGYVLLRVSDTGSGIAEELRERVFEPFFTTKEPGRGTGLGLATVYGIVQQCGGHIEFRSRPGPGTSFEVVLPLIGGDSQPTGHGTRPPLVRGTELILLVEDEPQVRKLTRLLLEQGGYRVVEAENGEAALTLAEQIPGIDLVLSDVSMPRMNGVELERRLRTRLPKVRVLLMSGYPDSRSQDASKGHALRDLLLKPFTEEKLLTRVRKVLDQPDHDP